MLFVFLPEKLIVDDRSRVRVKGRVGVKVGVRLWGYS